MARYFDPMLICLLIIIIIMLSGSVYDREQDKKIEYLEKTIEICPNLELIGIHPTFLESGRSI